MVSTSKLLALTLKLCVEERRAFCVPPRLAQLSSARSENNTPVKLGDIWQPKCQGCYISGQLVAPADSVEGSCFAPAPRLFLLWFRAETADRKMARLLAVPFSFSELKLSMFPFCVLHKNENAFRIKIIIFHQTFKKC